MGSSGLRLEKPGREREIADRTSLSGLQPLAPLPFPQSQDAELQHMSPAAQRYPGHALRCPTAREMCAACEGGHFRGSQPKPNSPDSHPPALRPSRQTGLILRSPAHPGARQTVVCARRNAPSKKCQIWLKNTVFGLLLPQYRPSRPTSFCMCVCRPTATHSNKQRGKWWPVWACGIFPLFFL